MGEYIFHFPSALGQGKQTTIQDVLTVRLMVDLTPSSTKGSCGLEVEHNHSLKNDGLETLQPFDNGYELRLSFDRIQLLYRLWFGCENFEKCFATDHQWLTLLVISIFEV